MRILIKIISVFFVFVGIGLFFSMQDTVITGNCFDVPIALEGTDIYTCIKYEYLGELFAGIVFPWLFLICGFALWRWQHRLGRLKKCLSGNDVVKPPFVLYLRSFVADQKTSKSVGLFSSFRTEEESLVSVFSDIAPVYAIGDPKDKKMPLGATRIYVDEKCWKEKVAEMAKKSVLVVLRLGSTESLWWEVEMVLERVPLENVVFVVPCVDDFSQVAMLYQILIKRNIDIGKLSIKIESKAKGSISRFIFFNRENTPFSKDVKIPRFTNLVLSYENILRQSLAELRERFGLTENKKFPLRKMRIFQFIILAYIPFLSVALFISKNTELKYQMPYEIVQHSIKNPMFITKYSEKINGNNLLYSMIEAVQGIALLNDTEVDYIARIEALTIIKMSSREFELLKEKQPRNFLLMIKKYFPKEYPLYIEIMSHAINLALDNPEKTIEESERLTSFVSENPPEWFVNIVVKNEVKELTQQDFIMLLKDIFEDDKRDRFADVLRVMTKEMLFL